MYTTSILNNFPFFKEYLEEHDMSGVLDYLTGLVSRPLMLKFVHHLIDQEIPFTVALLDLDNFKFINGTYGHKVGDGVLEGVAEDLIRYLGDYAIAGRIGSDEFMIVNLRDRSYDDVKKFYSEMYDDNNVLRKNIELDSCSPFITGTLGSATFPDDAKDFDSLFALIDKTLYHGKTKGRNCYVIYEESRHKDIVIKDLKGHSLYVTLHDLAEQFDSAYDVRGKFKAMYPLLKDSLRINNFYYMGKDCKVKDAEAGETLATVSDIEKLMKSDIFNSNNLSRIKEQAPSFYAFLEERKAETVLIVRLGAGRDYLGYLLCAEPGNLKIWQEDECAIIFFVGRMIYDFLRESNMTL